MFFQYKMNFESVKDKNAFVDYVQNIKASRGIPIYKTIMEMVELHKNKYKMQYIPPAKKNEAFCLWSPESEFLSVYTTECKKDFSFAEGSPADHKFTHCPFCGKKIKEKEFGDE